MMMFIRSLPAMVSNAKLNGAICTFTVLYGTTVAPALPESEKSVSRTVIFRRGSNVSTRRWNASELRNVRAAWGTRNDSVGSK